MNCTICKRELNNPDDPFSDDCGGDCAMCMLPIEFDIGYYATAMLIAQSIVDNIRTINEKETDTSA